MAGDVPETLINKRVLTLDIGSLVAGTRFHGEFEEQLEVIEDTAQHGNDAVLFIDELHRSSARSPRARSMPRTS